MIEPLDDELRAHVGAFQAVERPTAAARAATWAAIEARTGGDVVPLRTARARVSWALAALAAAVVLSLGLAAATAWREPSDAHVEAIHQTSDQPAPAAAEPRESPLPTSARAASDPPPTAGAPLPAGSAESPSAESPLPAGSAESPSAGAPLPAGSAESPSAGAPLPARSAESPQPAPAPVKARSESTARRRPPITDTPSLRPEEVASFQRAQAALADERYDDALQALDAHGRRFAGGLFEEERLVSRAAALCKLGRLDEADRARRQFLHDRPTSHLAERMRQICRPID